MSVSDVFNVIKIREISQSDLKKVRLFLEYINALVKEGVMISINEKLSPKEEKRWLLGKLKNKREEKEVLLVAEGDNKIVGIAGVRLRRWRESHIGEFGISVRKEYRGRGLGKKLGFKIIELAKDKLKPRPKFIRLSVFSENKVGRALYKKLGFKEIALIPQQLYYKGKLVDEIVMSLEV